jgi:cystathionine beta-lyase/cystathionine gamma-synthase
MHGAVINPVYQSATFVWKNLDKYPQFDYTRVCNPNKDSLEQVLASLEGANHCVYVGSGMAAILMAFSLLKSGDHLLIANDIYGGTWRMAHEIIDRNGIEVSDFDANTLEDFDQKVKPNTKMLIFEGPTNPKLRMPDIKAVCDKAKGYGILTVFDNTFASPYLLNPLDYGVDIVVHSTTKYINGHSDVIGGAVLTNDPDLHEKFFFYNRAVGLPPSPFDTFLTLRGLKTLPVRMRQHCENAQKVAELLYEDPRVEVVNYPGLPSHPDYEVAKKQLRGFGGMLSFELKGGREEAKAFAEATQVFLLAESLGGVESLVGYPWLMSHGSLTDEDKLARGIRPILLRLSVGIEDIEDILEDLRQALDAAFANSKVAAAR